MIAEWLTYVGLTFGALLPITNPLSTAPVFLAVTSNFPAHRREQQARMAAVYMCIILLVALFIGALVLKFFGITLPVLRIGGGLVITRIGFGMLDSRQQEQEPDADSTANSALDVALTPVAIPMLSGPGSIALTIAMATEASNVVSYLAVATGIVLVSCAAWITLHFSITIVRFIGNSGMQALTRIMGLLLVCIGVQFIATGIVEGLTGEVMTGLLREWLEGLRAPG